MSAQYAVRSAQGVSSQSARPPVRPSALPPYRLTALLGTLGALVILGITPAGIRAQGVVTQQAALEMAVPNASWDRRTAYLSEADLAEIAALASTDADVDDPVVTYYVAYHDGRPVSVVYFDAHLVRTLPEVIMVVVRPDGRVRRVEVLKFLEPPE